MFFYWHNIITSPHVRILPNRYIWPLIGFIGKAWVRIITNHILVKRYYSSTKRYSCFNIIFQITDGIRIPSLKATSHTIDYSCKLQCRSKDLRTVIKLQLLKSRKFDINAHFYPYTTSAYSYFTAFLVPPSPRKCWTTRATNGLVLVLGIVQNQHCSGRSVNCPRLKLTCIVDFLQN